MDGRFGFDALAAAVRDPAAGAVVLFEGVTREVPELEYEAYVEMAEARLRAIGEEVAAARDRWQHGGFAEVPDSGPALAAPELPPARLVPRGRVR